MLRARTVGQQAQHGPPAKETNRKVINPNAGCGEGPITKVRAEAGWRRGLGFSGNNSVKTWERGLSLTGGGGCSF